MSNRRKYKKEDGENENFLVSFYRNNKIMIWLLIIIIVGIIVMKYVTDNSKVNESVDGNVELSIEPNDISSVGIGNTINLMVNTNIEDAKIIWTSSNSNVATISNGSVTGMNYGKTTITATCIGNNQKKYSVSKEITVVEGNPNVELRSVNFLEGDLYLAYNRDYHLILTTSPSNALISNKVFSSSDEVSPKVVKKKKKRG